jgi:hypothetical protein
MKALALSDQLSMDIAIVFVAVWRLVFPWTTHRTPSLSVCRSNRIGFDYVPGVQLFYASALTPR